jgi:hypothetical protein
MTSICYCGAEAGYPHREDCPRPLYRANEREEIAWEAARIRRLEARARVELGRYEYAIAGHDVIETPRHVHIPSYWSRCEVCGAAGFYNAA